MRLATLEMDQELFALMVFILVDGGLPLFPFFLLYSQEIYLILTFLIKFANTFLSAPLAQITTSETNTLFLSPIRPRSSLSPPSSPILII